MAVDLLFRADCGDDVGLGHVMRCYAVAAAAASAGQRSALVTRDPAAAPLDRWRDLGAEVIALPGRYDDAERSIAIADRVGAGTLVIDRYDLDPGFFERLSASRLRLVVFDDLATIDPPCDLLVNPNPGAEVRFAAAYRRARRRLLGSAYTSIRPEVTTAEPVGGGGVLVSLGGGAVGAAVRRVALALTRLRLDRPIVVVGAPVAEDDIRGDVAMLPPGDLAPLLARADVVVCGGGVTACEAAHLGRPAVLTILADNQRPGAEALAAAGAAVVIESEAEAAEAVRRLLADAATRGAMAAAGRRLIDGRGAARIAAAIDEIAHHRGGEGEEPCARW